MKFDFSNKIVVVTGAASGIGYATAKKFVKLGACVHALDLDEKGLNDLVKEMENRKGSIKKIIADVGKPKEWREALNKERIDVLCNVAGIIDPRKPTILDEINEQETLDRLEKVRQDLQKVFDTNYVGPYLLSLFVAQKMIGGAKPAPKEDAEAKKHRRGVIINVGSTNVFTLHERRPAYMPLKAALHALTLLMAKALDPYGIRVNCVVPGATAKTKIVEDEVKSGIPMPLGINQPEDVANAIIFLSSDYARNVTGQLFVVDGGRCVAM